MTLICCPLNIDYKKDILKQLEVYINNDYDLLEIRLDYFYDLSLKNIEEVILLIKSCIQKPILVTLRTSQEGGYFFENNYNEIINFIINNKLCEYLDVEYYRIDEPLNKILIKAKSNNIKIILSYHQFEQNYSIKSLLNTYQDMSRYPHNIKKIAVLAKNNDDVVSFVKFCEQVKTIDEKKCLILMGELGCFSRFDLTYTNNNLLYASIEKNNAPGQITLNQLKQLIKK